VNTTTLGVILLLAVLFLIVMYIVFKIQELKIKRLEQANKHLLEKFMELLEVVNETTDLEITVVENGEKYKMRK
jgi:predicted Holliday junction resolvase-like endonuclease